MRKLLVIAALSTGVLFAGQSQAGTTGLSAGAGVWNASPSGSFRIDDDSDRVDVEDDLQLGSGSNALVWVQWDHIIPIVPNLQLRYTRLSLDGSGRVSRDFTFSGITVQGSDNVDTDLQLDQLDLIAYYGLWLPVVELDLGINFKYVDGEVEFTRQSTGETDRVSFSGIIPLLWARAEVGLPLTGVYAGGEIGAIGYSGDYFLDTTLRLGYRTSLMVGDLGLEAGWKQQKIRVDDFDGTDVDVRLQGPYAAATLSF